MASNNQSTLTQKRFNFCNDLGNLLNVYIFNEEITSKITLDAGKSAKNIKRSYDELVTENQRLKQQLADIQTQAKRITENKYYQQKVRLVNTDYVKRTHLSVVEKAQNPRYICCDICDRFVSRWNKNHILTDVCLSIRVSKELSKKSNKYILHKKKKKDLIVAFRNSFIILMKRNELMEKQKDFKKLIEMMEKILCPYQKKQTSLRFD
jgi:hypothetical protein